MGSDQVWGTFPAVSLAWRINEENFMKNIKWINSLKLRAGYGVTGIAPSNPYLATYRLGYTSNNDTFYYNGQWVNKLIRRVIRIRNSHGKRRRNLMWGLISLF